MKKVAIPVTNGILDAHFGHCRQFCVFETENRQVIKETNLTPPPHAPGLLPKWLQEQNVTDIIAGGIGQRAIHLFNEFGINVYSGAAIKSAKALIDDFVNGNLATSVNLCDH